MKTINCNAVTRLPWKSGDDFYFKGNLHTYLHSDFKGLHFATRICDAMKVSFLERSEWEPIAKFTVLAKSVSLCGNSVRRIGNTEYVKHEVQDMPHARGVADAICTQSMLPVYFGTGYAVNVPHIQRMDYGSELVLRFFPRGEDRSGSADDYTTVHTFSFGNYAL